MCITRFLRMSFFMGFSNFVRVGIEDSIECAVVFGTSERKHSIGLLDIPPGPRALETHMTDELVGRLDSSTPYGISSLASKPVVDSILMVREVSDELQFRLHELMAAAGEPPCEIEPAEPREMHFRRP